jgi:hypothetical protein
MTELEQIKCPKCGYKNIKISKRCTKCRYQLDDTKKSCPRCGRRVEQNSSKCECGFKFTKKRRSVLGNLLLSIFVMVLLIIVSTINKGYVEHFSLGIKVVLGFCVFVIIVRTLNNAEDEKISYSAEEEIVDKHKTILRMKMASNIAIIIGAIGVAAFLIYYYLFR